MEDEGPTQRPSMFNGCAGIGITLFVGAIFGAGGLRFLIQPKISDLEREVRKQKASVEFYDEQFQEASKEKKRLERHLDYEIKKARDSRARKTAFFVGHKCGIPELAEAEDLFTWEEKCKLINAGVTGKYLTFQKHEIGRGDTLGGVCKEYGANMQTVVDMNNVFSVTNEVQNIWDYNLIREGKLLLIPEHNLKTMGEYVVQQGDNIVSCMEKSREFFERTEDSCSYSDFKTRFYLLNMMEGRLGKDYKVKPTMKLLIPDDEIRD